MPRYDYRCSRGHVREVTHSMSESPEVICGAQIDDSKPLEHAQYFCSEPMQRVIGSTSFIPCSGMYAAENRIAVH